MKKIERYMFPFGMISVFFYFLYTVLGRLYWPEYNPVTTYISALTSDVAPNTSVTRTLSYLEGICMVIMLSALAAKAVREYNLHVRAGYIILLTVQVIATAGYALFPMKGITLDYSFPQNIVHSAISYTVVFFTFSSSLLISVGYCLEERTRKLGQAVLVLAIILGIFGTLYLFIVFLGYDILGLAQRFIIYTIMTIAFVLSFYYTFREKSIQKE